MAVPLANHPPFIFCFDCQRTCLEGRCVCVGGVHSSKGKGEQMQLRLKVNHPLPSTGCSLNPAPLGNSLQSAVLSGPSQETSVWRSVWLSGTWASVLACRAGRSVLMQGASSLSTYTMPKLTTGRLGSGEAGTHNGDGAWLGSGLNKPS